MQHNILTNSERREITMPKTAKKLLNQYTGTTTFFIVALLTSFNSAFFPYSLTGRLCAILWLITFSFTLFAGEYLINHISLDNKNTAKAVVNFSIWLLAALVLVLFGLVFQK